MKNLLYRLYHYLVNFILKQTPELPEINLSCVYRTYPELDEEVTVICHKRMTIGYSTKLKSPLWVAEKLTKTEVLNEDVERVNDFKHDPYIKTNEQASVKSFDHSGYDKGHMCCCEDNGDDKQADIESFYMTNMVPQIPENNRGIWHSLESKVRKLAEVKGDLYIITGPIFDGEVKKLIDGTPVPTRLFKMIFADETKEVWTIVMPNADIDSKNLNTYLVHLDDLRKIIDVLPNETDYTELFTI
jgi:endonuclease G